MDLIRTQTLSHGAGAPALRVVLMPGAYHTPNQFLDAGFAEAIRQRARRVELVLAVPELAHLTDRGWLTALHDELIAPARAQRIPIWLGGVSLGGFMALRFAAQYPALLDGLCLLAPYLGSRIIAGEIAADAAAGRWPVHHPAAADDDERHIWHYVASLGQSVTTTRVFFGYGDSDRFADTQRVLARVLHASCSTVRVVPGGHDWAVWRVLWDQYLDTDGAAT